MFRGGEKGIPGIYTLFVHVLNCLHDRSLMMSSRRLGKIAAVSSMNSYVMDKPDKAL